MLKFNVPLTVTRMEESGERHIMTKAIMWPGYIAVPVDADIDVGDKIERQLPNGKTWVAFVIEVNVLESPFNSSQDHTEVKYSTTPPNAEKTLVVSSLNSVKAQTFRRTDLRHLANALASGVTQRELDKFELGLDTDTKGQSKDSRAAAMVKHIFNGDHPDETFLGMLDFIYLESERSRTALDSVEYVQLMKVLEPRGVHLTDDGFQISSAQDAKPGPREGESAPSNQSQPEPLPLQSSRGSISPVEHHVGHVNLGGGTPVESQNNKVFIVRGRDDRPVQVLEIFLHFAGLQVMSWADAVDLTGKPTPDTYEVIKEAMDAAAAILVVFSPDDEARLKPAFTAHNLLEELQGQPRQNVLLEAGMAFAMAPERTIFVKSDATRDISDIAGFNWVTMDGTWDSRESLIRRLRRAGAPIKLRTENLTHHLAGDFKVN